MRAIYHFAWPRSVVACLLLVTPCNSGRAEETAPLPVGKPVLTAGPSDLVDWESGAPVSAADLHRTKNYGFSDPPSIAAAGQPMVLLALGNKRVFSAYEASAVIRNLSAAGTELVEMISSRNGALYRTRLAVSELGEIAALKDADRGFDPRGMTPMLSAYTATRRLPALDTLLPRAAFEIEMWLAANGRPMRGVKWLDGFLDLFVDVTSLRYAECAQPEASPLAFINRLATRYLQVAKSARQPETIDELPVENRFITLLNRYAFFYGQHLRANVSQPRLPPVFALRPEFRIYARRPGIFLSAGWLAMHNPYFVADMINAERRLRDKGKALAGLDEPPGDALERFEELRALRRARPWLGYEKQSSVIHELLYEIYINREQIKLNAVGFDYLIDPMIVDFRPDLANPIVAEAATSPEQMPRLLLDLLTDCRGATPEQITEKFKSLEARAERGNWNAQGEKAIQYHRSRLRKYGDPLIRLNPQLANRKIALIPDETK